MKKKKPTLNIGNLSSVGKLNTHTHTVSIPFGVSDRDGFIIDPKGVDLSRIWSHNPRMVGNDLHVDMHIEPVIMSHIPRSISFTTEMDNAPEFTAGLAEHVNMGWQKFEADQQRLYDLFDDMAIKCLTAGRFDVPPHDLEGK